MFTKQWWISNLQQGSTWRGAVWLLTAGGVAISPEVAEQVVVVGTAVAGALGVFWRD